VVHTVTAAVSVPASAVLTPHLHNLHSKPSVKNVRLLGCVCKTCTNCDHCFCSTRLVLCVSCVDTPLGLARTIYIRCMYGIFGREITTYTVIYGAYIRFWPTLHITYKSLKLLHVSHASSAGEETTRKWWGTCLAEQHLHLKGGWLSMQKLASHPTSSKLPPTL